MLKRHSFWNLVIQSGQIALGAAQGITLAADVQHVWNYAIAAIQASLGIMALWTRDSNNNDIIDIVEEKVQTQITVESKGPVVVKEVKESPDTPHL